MNHVSFDYTLKIITYDKRNYIDKNEMFTKKNYLIVTCHINIELLGLF